MNYKVAMSIFFMLTVTAFAQQPGRAELAKALQQSESELETCRQTVRTLQNALSETDALITARKSVSDSLLTNLRKQLFLQDSVTILLKTNSDTLQRMVLDYSGKLDEINRLYVHELKRQTRPWFFTGNGLKGLMYGVFVGAALGLVYGLAH